MTRTQHTAAIKRLAAEIHSIGATPQPAADADRAARASKLDDLKAEMTSHFNAVVRWRVSPFDDRDVECWNGDAWVFDCCTETAAQARKWVADNLAEDADD